VALSGSLSIVVAIWLWRKPKMNGLLQLVAIVGALGGFLLNPLEVGTTASTVVVLLLLAGAFVASEREGRSDDAHKAQAHRLFEYVNRRESISNAAIQRFLSAATSLQSRTFASAAYVTSKVLERTQEALADLPEAEKADDESERIHRRIYDEGSLEATELFEGERANAEQLVGMGRALGLNTSDLEQHLARRGPYMGACEDVWYFVNDMVDELLQRELRTPESGLNRATRRIAKT